MDDFLQAAAGPPAADTAPGAAVAMAAEEAMPQRRPHEPAVRDFLRIKVLSMGDGHTGKSCLIKRYRNSEVEFVLPRDCFGIRPLVLHFAAYHCPILLTVVTRQIFGLLLSPCRESGWCRYKISRVHNTRCNTRCNASKYPNRAIEERSEIRSHSDPSQPSCLTDRQYTKYLLNNTTLQNTAGFIQDKLRRYRINLQVSPAHAAKHILAAFDV